MGANKKKGQSTFRITAALFFLSAFFEILSITSDVLLFGEIRGGISAGIYHIIYIVLFVALGVGLWGARQWGYPLVFVTTALYTLDKLQFLFSQQAIEVLINTQMGGYESTLQAQGIDAALILQAIVLMTIVVILSWWGFALYTYWRRDYFKSIGE